MNYEEAIQYINEIPWTSRKIGLHRIKKMLDELGRPDKCLKFIHVAGTNGKGSVCSMLASVLKAAGYRTGLFTSPHLIKYNERMKVNGEEITDEEFAKVITKVAEASGRTSKAREAAEEKGISSPNQGKKAANLVSKISADTGIIDSPSEFEIITAAGIQWFKEKKCDIVILEVGLGGEYDSTNAIEEKELAVITPIGFDHMAILGNTLREIAKAKAGIISEGCDVVCALQSLDGIKNIEYQDRSTIAGKIEILKVISSKCLEMRAKLHIPDTFGFSIVESGLDGQTFKSRYSEEPLQVRLIGEYQLSNTLTVLEAIHVLKNKGYDIPEQAVRTGLKTVTWPARFEVLNRNPVFILDGAHNEHGIKAAVESLRGMFGDTKIIYIIGMLKDKSIASMLELLYGNAKSFITLTPLSERALNGEELAWMVRSRGFEAVSFNNVDEAIKHAFEISCETTDDHNSEKAVICLFGSLYLAGEVKELCSKLFIKNGRV